MASVVDQGINQFAWNPSNMSFLSLGVGMSFNVRLYQNDLSAFLDKNRVYGDFVEATFAGYAAIALVFNSFVTAPQPTHVDKGTAIFGGGYLWQYSSGSPQTIYGYYISFLDHAAANRVWAFEQFPSPITLGNFGDLISLELRMDCVDP